MALIICQGCEGQSFGTPEEILAWSLKHKCDKSGAKK